MLSAVKALCFWKFTVLNDVHSLSRIVSIRILWNFVTLFSTMISSSSLIMVYMTPCFKELLPFSLWKLVGWNDVCSLRWIIFIIILWNLVTLLSTIMSSSFRRVHIASCLQELLPFVNDHSLLINAIVVKQKKHASSAQFRAQSFLQVLTKEMSTHTICFCQ